MFKRRPLMVEEDLYQIQVAANEDHVRRETETAYQLMAGETVTLFGMPIKADFTDGLPLGFKTAEEMQEWAREKLAELRSKPPRLEVIHHRLRAGSRRGTTA